MRSSDLAKRPRRERAERIPSLREQVAGEFRPFTRLVRFEDDASAVREVAPFAVEVDDDDAA